ncbi:MAG: Proline--tRNA ligase [Hyphomicrobiaceae bacterium hypho_1]
MVVKTALKNTRDKNFSNWYHEVIEAAEMGEHSGVRGCMIIRPWGYAIWERLQRHLDDKIRKTGHENCYFPLFIPMELIEQEADHVSGFAKEMAVVTHHRLEASDDGSLYPSSTLKTPLIVRPTSEVMITQAFKRWIKSYRDLPLKLNQWANVVRWELRPRLFLRTSEFLWQEGHTVHETAQEANEEVVTMLECYRQLLEEFMSIPVISGVKSEGEKFPGAVTTHTIEAMMQDGRALQAGTSHNLGTNFAQASGIRYLGRDEKQAIPHTTSWGVSTRLIGALIMVHADDNGLRLPPRLAPVQIIIIPIDRNENLRARVHERCHEVANQIRALNFADEPLRVKIDMKDDTPSNKRWSWVKKGVPIIIEIGPKDLETSQLAIHRRDMLDKKAVYIKANEFFKKVEVELQKIQKEMLISACNLRDEKTVTDIKDLYALRSYFNDNFGFVYGKWSKDTQYENTLKEFGVTVRCYPYKQSGSYGTCIVSGRPAKTDALFAKAY